MSFTMPAYTAPDFDTPPLADAPLATFVPVEQDGVAPEGFHATTIYPEYFHVRRGHWLLAGRSRMDAVVVLQPDDTLAVTEFRRLRRDDLVAIGRTNNGEEGIYVHASGFVEGDGHEELFTFRSNRSRETAFSIDYDMLYDLLAYERTNGYVVWVVGPAVIFDHDARSAFSTLIQHGYVDALLAGNALATHDIEAAFFGTALGQELYHKTRVSDGHYKHLEAINTIRRAGSVEAAVKRGLLCEGVMYSLVTSNIPYVLAGSIRDDGPLPGVIADVYAAQEKMRSFTSQATTVIGLATQLHTIASGNMTPSFTFDHEGNLRPVYFYSVDMSEFAVNKLCDRGSLMAKAILTNVQDFIVHVARKLEAVSSPAPMDHL